MRSGLDLGTQYVHAFVNHGGDASRVAEVEAFAHGEVCAALVPAARVPTIQTTPRRVDPFEHEATMNALVSTAQLSP